MDINNVTQYSNLLTRTGLVEQIPNGKLIVSCVDEYDYNCHCGEKQKFRAAVYNRCKALYEESVRKLDKACISLLFQRLPDMGISFRQESNQHLRTITR